MTDTTVLSIAGVRLGIAQAGIKKPGRDDLLLIELSEGTTCAGVFTQNAFCAAPVHVARDHLTKEPRWLLINSGNANAGTGERGMQDARLSCRHVAEAVNGVPSQVLPFSTGVIGEYLPVDKIAAALPTAVSHLSEHAWEQAACAIMTTDTRPKLASRQVVLGEYAVNITGIAKGAGMIQPNMATMLAFIATDARVEQTALQQCLSAAADLSFNCITIDGDTSTNDACMLLASGEADNPALTLDSAEYPAFAAAIQAVCNDLAEMIVRDGEGATKFMRIIVEQACDEQEARQVAKTVAHSPLVKTAFFASDPNWGRILASVGRAGCENLEISGVQIWLGEVRIVANGMRDPAYTEEQGAAAMRESDIDVRIALGRGNASQRVLTCDFSYDYVRINAEYRT